MVLPVEDTGEVVAARAADRHPLGAGKVDIGREHNILTVEVFLLIDRRGKGAQLRRRRDLIRIVLRAGTAREDGGRIGGIVGARVAEQRLVDGDGQRRFERLVVGRAVGGILHGLILDERRENGLTVGGVKVGRVNDLGGNDLLILHRDAHDDLLVRVAAVVGAVLVIIVDARIRTLDRDIGNARGAGAEHDGAVLDRPGAQRSGQIVLGDRKRAEVAVELVGERLRGHVPGRERLNVADKRAVHEFAVLIVAGRNLAAERDRRVKRLILDGQPRAVAEVGVVALADGGGHTGDGADIARPAAGGEIAGGVAVGNGAGLAASDAAEVGHAAVVHILAVGLTGDVAERVAVDDHAEGVHGSDAAGLGVGRLAEGVQRYVGPGIEDVAALTVADQAAGEAVVGVAAVFGARGDVTGRPAVVDDGKIAAAGQCATDSGLFIGREVDVDVLQAEVFHDGAVHERREQAEVNACFRADRGGLAADGHVRNLVTLAVEAAAEGLRAVGHVADRRPGFAGEVNVRAEDDVFAGVIRLCKRGRKRLELVKVLDDPGGGLRAGAALEEVEHRRVGLDKDVRAEHSLAVAHFPAVPRGGTHGNEHIGREADVIARKELVCGGEALDREAAVHGVGKGGAGRVRTGDVVRVAADKIAEGNRSAGRAVDGHGGLAVVVAVGDDAIVAAARGHLADEAAHSRFIRRDGHCQRDIAGSVAVVEHAGPLADETADGGTDLGRGRVARDGRHTAEGGAVGDHGAVGVRGNEAAGRAQAVGGLDLHGHIRPGVGEIGIEIKRRGQAAAICPLPALRADNAAGDGAVIDACILAHAERAADQTADKRTIPVPGELAVHGNVGQVQVCEAGTV